MNPSTGRASAWETQSKTGAWKHSSGLSEAALAIIACNLALGELFLSHTPCSDSQERPLLAEELEVVDCYSPKAAGAGLGVPSKSGTGRMGMFTCC